MPSYTILFYTSTFICLIKLYKMQLFNINIFLIFMKLNYLFLIVITRILNLTLHFIIIICTIYAIKHSCKINFNCTIS